jgi:hypothetical protein
MSKESNSEKTLRQLLAALTRGSTKSRVLDLSSAKDLIGSVASWAGKGKDEMVQMLCREIGIATAAVLAEPINQIVENRKLTITFELTPKNQSIASATPKKVRKKSVKKTKSK